MLLLLSSRTRLVLGLCIEHHLEEVKVQALMEVTGVESEVELARRVVEEEKLVASGQEHVVPLDLGVQIRHHGVAGTIVISGAETTSFARVRAAIPQEGVS